MHSLLLLGIIAGGLATVIAGGLYLASRWVKSPRRSYWRCYGLTWLLAVGYFGGVVGAEIAWGLYPIRWWVWLTVFGGLLAGTLIVFRWRFAVTVAKSSRVLLCFLLGIGASVGIWFGIVAQLLLEFVQPSRSGSMAPTARSDYAIQTCRHCEGTLVVSLGLSDAELAAGQARGKKHQAICDRCFQRDFVEETFENLRIGDYWLLNHTQTPRRWDLVVFHMPLAPDDPLWKQLKGGSPSDVFVKRVVGLPNEEVMIDDGSVWINGVREVPPSGVPRIPYTQGPLKNQKYLATREQPLKLGPDEYFVLGDNTTVSGDSRMFGAVPRKKIIGVQDVCVWPPSRWRLMR